MAKQVGLIEKIFFAKVTPNLNYKVFVIYITVMEVYYNLDAEVYLS